MKTKSFKQYLEKRLNKSEINEIEKAAKVEFEILSTLQQEVANDVIRYMDKKKMGFNDLVRQLGKSPTQVSHIIKGDANLTMTTIAQLYALMGKKVHIKKEALS
jgi:antitoxin component HigA of HigAB toxin-antitoxin module